MRLARLPGLETVVGAVLALTIVLFVFGSSGSQPLLDVGTRGRWVALLALCALSLLLALRSRRSIARPSRAVVALGLALGIVALESALWSVAPRLSAERGFTVLVLVTTGAALAYAAAGRPRTIEKLLVSIVVGVSLVCIAGLVLL